MSSASESATKSTFEIRRVSRQVSCGYALVMLMLFLPIFGVLGLGAAMNSLMEYKLSVFYENKVAAFYLAEKNLLRAEQDFLADMPIQTAQYKQVYLGRCGVLTYLLTATSDVRGAYSKLCSVVIRNADASNCLSQPQMVSGRQSFWVVV